MSLKNFIGAYLTAGLISVVIARLVTKEKFSLMAYLISMLLWPLIWFSIIEI